MSARLETPVICDKCGFSSLSKSGMTRHKKMCDTIPAGRELEEVIDNFPTFSIPDISRIVLGGVHPDTVLGRLGWNKKKINARYKRTSSLKRSHGVNIYRGKGPTEFYRARCLRCEILLKTEEEITLRMCVYCTDEDRAPTLMSDRVLNSDLIFRIQTDTNQGIMSTGWDGTMMTFFANVRSFDGRLLWSTGNSPFQIKTIRDLKKKMTIMGVRDCEVIIPIVESLPTDGNEELATRTERYINSHLRYEWTPDDEEE